MLRTNVIRELDEVIDLLIDKEQIVAIFQGESEWGPRALGNRSILFDPRHPQAKQIVNKVKMREDYRPFAGSVMLEHAHEYFEMKQLKESPWMSFAIQAKEKAYKEDDRQSCCIKNKASDAKIDFKSGVHLGGLGSSYVKASDQEIVDPNGTLDPFGEVACRTSTVSTKCLPLCGFWLSARSGRVLCFRAIANVRV